MIQILCIKFWEKGKNLGIPILKAIKHHNNERFGRSSIYICNYHPHCPQFLQVLFTHKFLNNVSGNKLQRNRTWSSVSMIIIKATFKTCAQSPFSYLFLNITPNLVILKNVPTSNQRNKLVTLKVELIIFSQESCHAS